MTGRRARRPATAPTTAPTVLLVENGSRNAKFRPTASAPPSAATLKLETGEEDTEYAMTFRFVRDCAGGVVCLAGRGAQAHRAHDARSGEGGGPRDGPQRGKLDDLDGQGGVQERGCAPAQGRARGVGRRGGSACGYAWLSVSRGVGTAAVVGLAPATRPRAFISSLILGRACTLSAVPSGTVSGTVIKTFICVGAACVAWGVCTPIVARRACHKTGGLGLVGSGVIR